MKAGSYKCLSSTLRPHQVGWDLGQGSGTEVAVEERSKWRQKLEERNRDSTGGTNVLLGHCGSGSHGVCSSPERKPIPGHASWWLRCPEPLQPGSGHAGLCSAKSVIAGTCPRALAKQCAQADWHVYTPPRLPSRQRASQPGGLQWSLGQVFLTMQS